MMHPQDGGRGSRAHVCVVPAHHRYRYRMSCMMQGLFEGRDGVVAKPGALHRTPKSWDVAELPDGKSTV